VIEYRHLTAEQVNTRIDDFRAVYAAVFSQPPYNEGPEMADKFVGWVRDESAEPGFDFVEASALGVVIGFAYGYQQRPGKWWRGADRPAPAEVTAGPTFAVMEWAVLPDHRGQGVGRASMDELLAGRTEPFAVLTVNPAADARAVYERWRWRHVASTAPADAGMHVMIQQLPLQATAAPVRRAE
jgi:ribosomal protein S18 acetylase RimI-like enzyme